MKVFYCLASLLLLTLSAAAGRADDGDASDGGTWSVSDSWGVAS